MSENAVEATATEDQEPTPKPDLGPAVLVEGVPTVPATLTGPFTH
jgi:hypothetical protein